MQHPNHSQSLSYDRALLLHGVKRNEVLTLEEVEQYGRGSFGAPDYVSIYGMPPREWWRLGIRLLGRTAVECTRDSLADRIGFDVASVAAQMSANRWMVIDPFAGSCNTLFWILRHLPNAAAIAFESNARVFELTRRNLSLIDSRIEVLRGSYESLLSQIHVPADYAIAVFVAPPWGRALDEAQGLDLRRTTPPISEVTERVTREFSGRVLLFAMQVYEKVEAASLAEVRAQMGWSELRVYDINENGGNHGVLLGTRGWMPG
jgi:16S rRNA G966 N2-methylase RsmD